MWKAVCCAVQGSGHKKLQLPCQDKTFATNKNGVHIIALADGAGSARLSHYGAERVVQDASEYIATHFMECIRCDDGRAIKMELLEFLRKGLEDEAEKHQCDSADLASTLLFASVYQDYFILVHIGDGVIGYLEGETLKVASAPDNGEFANATTFVTSTGALASMRLFKGDLKDKDAFVLMSDGSEQSLYNKSSKQLAGVIKRLMHRTCLVDKLSMEAQLESAFNTVIARNTQDDCSIAILARPSECLCSFESLSFSERRKWYGFNESSKLALRQRRLVHRYDEILRITYKPQSLFKIARLIHLKPKYTRKHLDHLITLGLLTKHQHLYQRVQ